MNRWSVLSKGMLAIGLLIAGCSTDGESVVASGSGGATTGVDSRIPPVDAVVRDTPDPCQDKNPSVVIGCMSKRASIYDAAHKGEKYVPFGSFDIPNHDPQGNEPTEKIFKNSPGFDSSKYVINNAYGRLLASGGEQIAWAGGLGDLLAAQKGLTEGRGVVVLVEAAPGKAFPDTKTTEALAPEGTTSLTIVNYKYPVIYLTDTNGKNVSLNLESLKFGSDKAPAGLKPVDLTPAGQ